MKTVIQSIRGFTIQATDGEVGKVETLYFDDQTWAIRYLVVNVGNWLLPDQILLSPVVVTNVDSEEETISVALTKEQVKNSPHMDTKRPVSRQYEVTLHDYYNWSPYWIHAPTYSGGLTAPTTAALERQPKPTEKTAVDAHSEVGDSHLRSTSEVEGYHINAVDGEIGHIDKFLVDTNFWFIRYFVIDTKNWLPGKKVIVAPSWIENINWVDREVSVDMTQEMIKSSPEYEAEAMVNREYERRLYDHYQAVAYWKEAQITH
jgi:hypothetical protein